MKDNNYYVIQGWMVNKLELKGNDLLLFAVIYGFSQDNESKFTGSLNYLCNSLGCSKPTVLKSLKELINKKYIKKTELFNNGLKFCEYSVLFTGSKESLPLVKNLNKGGKESLPNNTINNNICPSFGKDTKKPSIKSKVVRLDLLERYLVMFNTIKQKEVGRKSCITSSNKKVIEAWNKYMSETNEDDLVSNKIPLIRKAIQAACRDDYHKKFKHKYITPQFFLRVDKIESWADIYESEHAKSPTTWVSKHENV
tara:strand:+ start:422 stop:1183 length:762 start_codon:yes stop_codon:yes gene_type:complete